jgi:Cdc6-like AAA superfamily ATPase
MSSKLGFSDWPFRMIPDEDFIRVWCGRKELQQKLDKIFRGILQRPMFQIYLVYGDFGTGKTHSIEHMLNKYRVEAKLLTSELEYDVTIRTFTQLYQALTSRLDFETIVEWPNPPAKDFWHDFKSFVGAIKAKDEEERTIATRWFTGEEKSKKALNRIGIRSPVESVDATIRAFSQLTRLAGKNKSAVVLFIDEFQHIGKLNKNWKESILNGLTKLVNSSPKHFCLIISFRLRMPMKILSIIPESMKARFPGDPFIEVANFSKDEAEEFMQCLFKKFRTREAKDPYHPFTAEAFEEILAFLKERNVEYNPRSLMKIFGHVSERFEDSNHSPPISTDFVKVSLWSYRA